MARRSTASIALAAGFGLVGLVLGFSGCFIEPTAPSTFRCECASGDVCASGALCAQGLCQQPCGGEDDDPCAQEAPVCLNGYCSSICPIPADSDEVDVCPSPQSCASLSGTDDPGGSGVCTILCEDDSGCGDGEVCFVELGLCVATCTDSSECGSGEECLGGFCAPSDAGGGGFP